MHGKRRREDSLRRRFAETGFRLQTRLAVLQQNQLTSDCQP